MAGLRLELDAAFAVATADLQYTREGYRVVHVAQQCSNTTEINALCAALRKVSILPGVYFRFRGGVPVVVGTMSFRASLVALFEMIPYSTDMAPMHDDLRVKATRRLMQAVRTYRVAWAITLVCRLALSDNHRLTEFAFNLNNNDTHACHTVGWQALVQLRTGFKGQVRPCILLSRKRCSALQCLQVMLICTRRRRASVV